MTKFAIYDKNKYEQFLAGSSDLLITQLFASAFLGWPAEKANNRIEKVSHLGAETTKDARFKLYNS